MEIKMPHFGQTAHCECLILGGRYDFEHPPFFLPFSYPCDSLVSRDLQPHTAVFGVRCLSLGTELAIIIDVYQKE
jgi:hypothetical protein